jgi:hypothetical protein
MVTNVSARRLYTKRCVSVIIMLNKRSELLIFKYEVTYKNVCYTLPPLLTSKNGGGGMMLLAAARNVEAVPWAAERPLLRTGRPQRKLVKEGSKNDRHRTARSFPRV